MFNYFAYIAKAHYQAKYSIEFNYYKLFYYCKAIYISKSSN